MTLHRLLARRLRSAAAGVTFILAGACGGDEAQAADDHTPVSYTVLVDDLPAPTPLTLVSGQTVRVRLKFANAASEDLDDVEGEHFGGLTFSPTSLATVTRVSGHNYRFDVTGGEAGAGIVRISFGHDAAADESSFPAAGVTVQSAP